MRVRALSLVLALAFAVAGCAGGDLAGTSPVLDTVKLAAGAVKSARAASRATASGGGATLPQGLSRAALAGVDGPLLLAQIEKTGASATLRLARSNGGYDTYASPDKLTMTFRDGLLSASRGMAGDLLAAETEPVLAALRARRAASYPKTLRYFGGDRQIILSRLDCEMQVVGPESIEVLEVAHGTTHLAEICTDRAGGQMRNDYWIGADRVLWKSRQFLHPALGYVTVQRLLR